MPIIPEHLALGKCEFHYITTYAEIHKAQNTAFGVHSHIWWKWWATNVNSHTKSKSIRSVTYSIICWFNAWRCTCTLYNAAILRVTCELSSYVKYNRRQFGRNIDTTTLQLLCWWMSSDSNSRHHQSPERSLKTTLTAIRTWRFTETIALHVQIVH